MVANEKPSLHKTANSHRAENDPATQTPTAIPPCCSRQTFINCMVPLARLFIGSLRHNEFSHAEFKLRFILSTNAKAKGETPQQDQASTTDAEEKRRVGETGETRIWPEAGAPANENTEARL